MPDAWTGNAGGVIFELEARTANGDAISRAASHVNPRQRLRDRRWRRLAISLPADARGALQIVLRTRVPSGGSPANAWAVWGDPEIVRRRPYGDQIRMASHALRTYGIDGVYRRVRSGGGPPTDQQRYAEWIARNTPGAGQLEALAGEIASWPLTPRISIITPVYNTDPVWLRACIESVRRQVYPLWELCLADDASTEEATREVLRDYEADPRIHVCWLPENVHISRASNAALQRATGEYIALLDHDDELTPDALAEMVRAINANPDADVLYSDEDKLDPGGVRCDPFMKPDWSPEHFLSSMYTCHLTVVRRSLVEDVQGFRPGFEGAQDYDLWLRLSERTNRIVHVPRVLYHWRKIPGSAAASPMAKPYALDAARRAIEEHVARRGMDATVEPGLAVGLWRVRRRIQGEPRVTVIVPTDGRTAEMRGGRVDLLVNCLRSVVTRTTYARYDILVVDNGTLSADALAFLEEVPHRRVTYAYEPPFNFSHKLNFAASHATGEHLVILNDDIEVIDDEWMTALLELSQDPGIGAVGGKLLYPDGRLQHIGVVTGVCGIAAHVFHQAEGHSAGYAGSAMTIRNYTAVTGACMMTRRDVFEEVGGFNERLRVDFNDVDYCLKVRRAGYRIVYTPYARLYHHESGSFGERRQRPEEIDEMRETWGSTLTSDPYYNRNLTVDFPDCRLRDSI
jgi:GT2 family glycosyltransferase